jgi:hypothetical protein
MLTFGVVVTPAQSMLALPFVFACIAGPYTLFLLYVRNDACPRAKILATADFNQKIYEQNT